MSLYDNRKDGYTKTDAPLNRFMGLKKRMGKKTMTTDVQPTLDPVELQNRNRQYDTDESGRMRRDTGSIAKAKTKRYFPQA